VRGNPAAGKPRAGGRAFRTAWGDPDLQGIWIGSTLTPLERPAALAGKVVLSEAEAVKLEKEAEAPKEPPPQADGADLRGREYNREWLDNPTKLLPDRRTSLIVDPPDGRLPFTAEGAKIQEESLKAYGKGNYESWLGLDTGERCLTDGPPIYFTGSGAADPSSGMTRTSGRATRW
jgi:hypothetical protein